MNTNIKDEELSETSRHNVHYREEKPYILQPLDWEKFDKEDYPTHGYVYSVKCLGDIEGKNVLDLGCGNGWLSIILAKRRANVHAIDISSEAINSAKIMADINQVSSKIIFNVGSAYDLEYPDNYFDLVIGQAILHHLSDKTRLSNSLFRVLKNGGKAVFSEAFGDSYILERIRLLFPVPLDEEDKTHWNDQIKYSDLNIFKKNFLLKFKEFQLLSRIDRIIEYKSIIDCVGKIDLLLLKCFPFLRRYARTIVIELIKPM